MNRTYVEHLPLPRAVAERRLASTDVVGIVSTLIGLSLHELDWEWVQRHAEALASHPSPEVRRAVATVLGNLAMIHGQLDVLTAAPILLRLAADPEVAVEAADAIEEVETGTGLSVSAA
jgi:hypothetical protein